MNLIINFLSLHHLIYNEFNSAKSNAKIWNFRLHYKNSNFYDPRVSVTINNCSICIKLAGHFSHALFWNYVTTWRGRLSYERKMSRETDTKTSRRMYFGREQWNVLRAFVHIRDRSYLRNGFDFRATRVFSVICFSFIQIVLSIANWYYVSCVHTKQHTCPDNNFKDLWKKFGKKVIVLALFSSWTKSVLYIQCDFVQFFENL